MTVIESASKVLSKGERLKGGHLSAARSAVKLLTLTLDSQVCCNWKYMDSVVLYILWTIC